MILLHSYKKTGRSLSVLLSHLNTSYHNTTVHLSSIMHTSSASGTSFRRPLSVCVPEEGGNCAHACHTEDTLFSPGCTTPGHSFNSLRVRHAQAGTIRHASGPAPHDMLTCPCTTRCPLPLMPHAGSKQEGAAACLVWSAGMHEQGRCQALTAENRQQIQLAEKVQLESGWC